MDFPTPCATTYPVDCGKYPLLDLDADEYGNFIAINEEKIWTNTRQLPVPQSFRLPLVRELNQEQFLVVDAPLASRDNGRIYDWSGRKLHSFDAG